MNKSLELLLLVLVCGYLSISGTGELLSGTQSLRWPIVKGKVTESSVLTEQSSYDNNALSKPQISYKYEVGGKQYVGDRVYFGQMNFGFGFSFFAKRLVRKYPQDRAVQVSYHPVKPDKSVLEPGVHVFSMVKIVLALAAAIMIWRSILKRQNNLEAS